MKVQLVSDTTHQKPGVVLTTEFTFFDRRVASEKCLWPHLSLLSQMDAAELFLWSSILPEWYFLTHSWAK